MIVVALALAIWAEAGIRPEARPIAEAIAGRALTDAECGMMACELWKVVARGDELLADWLAQDAGLAVREYPVDMEDAPGRFKAALAKMGVEVRDGDWKAAFAEYRVKCLERRAKRLTNLMAWAQKWVICRHHTMGGSHYAYTEAQSDALNEHFFPRGRSQLCLVEARPDGLWQETVLLDGEGVCYRDADVSFDGKRVVYAFKADDRQDDYHLYEMELETREVRQLTFGRGFADYEPCYLPNGQIIFNSTRCVQVVDCAFSDVSNLYRIEADGSGMTRIAYDQVHDNYPTIGWDARVLYTRWEYSDRSQIFTQPLFGMEWDGTGQRAVYADNSWFPTTTIHARQVPDSPLIYAISTGHHTYQPGELIRIDPREGRQENEGVWCIGPLRRAEAIRVDEAGQKKAISAYPYPFREDELLVAHMPEGWPPRRSAPFHDFPEYHSLVFEPIGLYWMNVDGEREQLLPRFGAVNGCGRMVPVRPRPQPVLRTSSVDRTRRTGTVFIQDVYKGVAMNGVERGTVKALRVVGIDYRPIGIGRNGNHGRGGGAVVTTPVSLAQGAWDPKIPVGEVRVEEDGSCQFTAPAHLPFYFMLLDERGRTVQTMRSWTVLQPNETASCVGCHENRNEAVPVATGRSEASRKPPQELAPILDTVRGLSFRRDIQPILNARCVSCHAAGVRDKPDLSDTPVYDPVAQRIWNRAYLSLTHAHTWLEREGYYTTDPLDPRMNWVPPASEPTPLPPYYSGSAKSKWFTERLDKGHCKELTDGERRRLAMWVDLAVPYCGDYREASMWTDSYQRLYDFMLEKRKIALGRADTPEVPRR